VFWRDIFTIRPDGSDAQQLTAFENGAFDPAWSPDGRTLATDALLNDGDGIHLIPARTRHGELNTGDKARRVTLMTDGGYDSESQFSPDGKWIVFTRYSVECTDEATFDDCTTRIFRVRTNGTRLEQLTGPELNASAPDYHPSGRYIAFDTHDNGVAPNAGHIMVMDDDGLDKRGTGTELRLPAGRDCAAGRPQTARRSGGQPGRNRPARGGSGSNTGGPYAVGCSIPKEAKPPPRTSICNALVVAGVPHRGRGRPVRNARRRRCPRPRR
jgi:dipeptidyl aminopeptidase/acylaminoacyl peptidase